MLSLFLSITFLFLFHRSTRIFPCIAPAILESFAITITLLEEGVAFMGIYILKKISGIFFKFALLIMSDIVLCFVSTKFTNKRSTLLIKLSIIVF